MRAYTKQAQLFRCLAHPVRLQILDILRRGEECVCHMEAVLGRRQSYISQQLMILRDAGLVDSRRDGLNVFYCLAAPETITPLLDVALGPLGQAGRHNPAGCPCPHCAPVSVPEGCSKS
ncbi:MAG: winged helix-turn-helix transcriptional regulator [Anaerolineae bacterium]|nr:winged helix-turn-helix transcriptional regulator [Anaerolineae bacterium]